jgi:outer membrane protein TolC
MNRKILLILIVLIVNSVFAQKSSLTLDSCLHLAKLNYPLLQQNGLIQQMEENDQKGLNHNRLPKLSFHANATYQSEVTNFDLPGLGAFANIFPVFPKDNYAATLELEQTIYDAGLVKEQKKVEKVNAENEHQKNEVELYKLVDRVAQLYSNILLSRANMQTLILYKEDISNKESILAASLKNGLALQSNVDELEAEELKTDQNLIESRENIQALYQSMAILINIPLNDSTGLPNQPIGGAPKGNDVNRPELKWFDSQKGLLEEKHILTNKAALPILTISGDGNYGRPGYNILDQNMRFFGIAGINLKWNIGALYNLNVEKQKLSINKQMVDVQKEIFDLNLKTTLSTQTAQVNTLKSIIEKDKSIIEKRHNITLTSANQLQNGNITSSEYLIQLNAELQAVLNQKIHEIKLMNAISNINTSKGITNF